MVVKKKKIVIGGQEVEVDVFETRLVPGSGKESEAIEWESISILFFFDLNFGFKDLK